MGWEVRSRAVISLFFGLVQKALDRYYTRQTGWDSIVLARVRDRADLDNLTKTVFTLDGVSRSYTHVVLNTVKEQAFPEPDVER